MIDSMLIICGFVWTDRDIALGHRSRGNPPPVEWEPFFCVLNQLDQTFTSYRSEEMSVSHFLLCKYKTVAV